MRPAVSAGLVGAGIAAVLVIGLGLVLAVQVLVFVAALPLGLLIGWYAGFRSRAEVTAAAGSGAPPPGWPRALADAFVAGLMTAAALALFYALVRLSFFYLDNGFRAGGPPYACASGPECSYQRALDTPAVREALEEAGIRDMATYTAYFLQGQLLGAGSIVGLVLAGAFVGAAIHRSGWSGDVASTIVSEGPP